MAVVTLAACGRLGFTQQRVGGDAAVDGKASDGDGALADGSALDGMRALPALVASSSAFTASGATITVSVPATGSGHLVAVGVVMYNNGATVLGVADNTATTYVSANARAKYSSAGSGAAEIWYAAASQSGATSVVVTLTGTPTGGAAWVAEVAGIDTTNALDAIAIANSVSYNGTVTGPTIATTSPNELVFTVEQAVGAASGVAAAGVFTALSPTNGDDSAYYIAPTTGSYAAVWTVAGSGGACATSATFTAALL